MEIPVRQSPEHKQIKIVGHHPVAAPKLVGHVEAKMGSSKRYAPLYGVWIGVSAVILIAFVFALNRLHTTKLQQRREALQLGEIHKSARSIQAGILEAVTLLSAMRDPAEEKRQGLEEAMRFVLAEAAPAPGPAAGMSETPPTPAAAPLAAEPAAPAAGADDDLPPGMMSREELLRQKQEAEARRKAGSVQAAPAEPARQTAPALASGYAQRQSARQDPRIKQLYDKSVLRITDLTLAMSQASEHRATAMHVGNLIQTERNLPKCQSRLLELQNTDSAVKECVATGRKALAELDSDLKEAKEIRDTTQKDRERARVERERREADARHKAKVAAEEENAREARRNAQSLLPKNDFEGALQSIESALARSETEEAKRVINRLVLRYKRLGDLKRFLIERLNADPFHFGWIQDVSPVDTEGADATGVKARGKVVPWSAVTQPQLTKFFNYYLNSEKIRLSQRGELCLNLAVLYHEMGNSGNSDTYRQKAVKLCPDLTEDASQLLTE